MRAGARLLGGALLAGTLALAGCQSSSQAQRPAPVPVPVKVQPAEEGAISSALSFSGSVQARDQVELVAQSSGRIEKILVDVGSVVKAGEPIAQIETETLRVNVKSAEAGLQSAQARLSTTLQGARPEEIAAARAALEAARARYQNMVNGGRVESIASAEADLASARARLADIEAGAKAADLAAAQAAVDTATAGVASAETKLNQLLNPTAADIQAAAAAVEQARASLSTAQGRQQTLLTPVQADIKAAEAGVAAAQVALSSAEARLADLRLQPKPADLQAAQTAVETAEAALDQAKARKETVMVGLNEEKARILTEAYVKWRIAKVRLEELEQRNAPQAEIDEARGELQLALERVKLAEEEVNWLKPGVSAQDLVLLDTAIETAQAQLKAATARYEQVKAGPTTADMKAAESALEQARAGLASAQARHLALTNPSAADRSTAQAAVDSATAALASAEAKLAQLQNPTPADVQAARSGLDSARATLASNQAKLQQLKDGPTAADLQAARSAVQKAEQGLATAKNPTTELELKAQQHALLQAENNTALVENKSTTQDIQTATAAVATAEAQLEQAQLALAKATLTAPFDAIVAKKYLSEGAMAGGQQAVVSLVSSATEIVFNVEEASLGRLQEGQPVTLTVPAYGEKPFKGKVTSIAPVADAASRTFAVKAVPDENDGQLKAGMFANLNVTVASKDAALLVQRAAIVQRPDGPVVFVARDDKAELRKVKLGLQSEALAEIAEGLTAGEQVIVQGNRTLRGNDLIKVIP